MGSKVARALAALGTVAIAVAQNVTVPAILDGVEGGGGTNIPFGSNQACRYQCIYDAEELPWTGPRVITGIRLRADNNQPLAAIAAKGWLDVSVLMSTTDKTAVTASPVFDENRGSDATWVILNQQVQLPAQPLMTQTGPRPANIVFTFTAPWAYGLTPAIGSLPAPRNLLVELHIHSQPSGSYRVDSMSNCVAPQNPFGLSGQACVVPGNAALALDGDVSMLAGATYTWRVQHASASLPFLVLVDITNNGGLFGNPAWALPYPMFDPANPALPSAALAALLWPAPDCYLNVNPVVALGGVADTLGVGYATGSIPAGRQLVGQTFYAQALVFAPTANPLHMVASRGLATTVCGPLGVARIHAFYNNAATPPPTPPTSGVVQVGIGLVLEVM